LNTCHPGDRIREEFGTLAGIPVDEKHDIDRNKPNQTVFSSRNLLRELSGF